MGRVYVRCLRESIDKEKSAAVFAVRRANYTHRRKGVFNGESIEDSAMGGNVRYRTKTPTKERKSHIENSFPVLRSLLPLEHANNGPGQPRWDLCSPVLSLNKTAKPEDLWPRATS
jgi:hypothetical protein